MLGYREKGRGKLRVKQTLLWQNNLHPKDKVLLQEFAANYLVIITIITAYLTPAQLLSRLTQTSVSKA